MSHDPTHNPKLAHNNGTQNTSCYATICHVSGQLKVKVQPSRRIVEISSGRRDFGDGRLYLCALSPLIEGSNGHQASSTATLRSPEALFVVGSVFPVPSTESVPGAHLKIVVARPETGDENQVLLRSKLGHGAPVGVSGPETEALGSKVGVDSVESSSAHCRPHVGVLHKQSYGNTILVSPLR